MLELNLIDVFAGVGGFTLGFRGESPRRKWRVGPRLLVDVDPSACKVCRRNMPDVRYSVADVHCLSGPEIRRRAGLDQADTIHFLLGGPPCQGFSFLGKRLLDDPRNVHVVDFLRLVKELRPLVAVMENVPLIITHHEGAVINEVCASLSAVGYASCADVLQANEYGVPQIRRRAFVIAYRGDMHTVPEMPIRTHERVSTASDLTQAPGRVRFEESKLPYVSVEEAIGDLPALKANDGDEVMYYPGVAQSGYQEEARRGAIAIFNHRSRAHSAAFLKKVSIIEEGGANKDLPKNLRFSDNYYSQAYARLCRHGLANTITTSFANPGSGRFLHYRDLRAITVREAARLQGFPDTFVFDGELASQMRHVGNAVPPLLARAIRDHVVEDVVAHLESPRRNGRGIHRVRGIESPEKRSAIMRAVPSKNTGAELRLRKALSAAGIRGYRTHSAKVPGNPDIVFGRKKVAIFVDGCFWHGCPKCYREPASNKAYWQMKVRRNRDRDARVTLECRKAGWKVVRIWEHDVLANASRAARRVIRALAARNQRVVRRKPKGVKKG